MKAIWRVGGLEVRRVWWMNFFEGFGKKKKFLMKGGRSKIGFVEKATLKNEGVNGNLLF